MRGSASRDSIDPSPEPEPGLPDQKIHNRNCTLIILRRQILALDPFHIILENIIANIRIRLVGPLQRTFLCLDDIIAFCCLCPCGREKGVGPRGGVFLLRAFGPGTGVSFEDLVVPDRVQIGMFFVEEDVDLVPTAIFGFGVQRLVNVP